LLPQRLAYAVPDPETGVPDTGYQESGMLFRQDVRVEIAPGQVAVSGEIPLISPFIVDAPQGFSQFGRAIMRRKALEIPDGRLDILKLWQYLQVAVMGATKAIIELLGDS
jgi:hypothetical protein